MLGPFFVSPDFENSKLTFPAVCSAKTEGFSLHDGADIAFAGLADFGIVVHLIKRQMIYFCPVVNIAFDDGVPFVKADIPDLYS